MLENKMKYFVLVCLSLLSFVNCSLGNLNELSKSRNCVFLTNGRQEICDKKNPTMMPSLKAEFNCMKERMARVKTEYPEVIKSCWKDILNIDFPETDEALIQVFCKISHISFNIANDCVIREVIRLLAEKEYSATSVKKPSENNDIRFNRSTSKNLHYLSQCADGTYVFTSYRQCFLKDSAGSICLPDVIQEYQSKVEPVKESGYNSSLSKQYCKDKETLSSVIMKVKCVLIDNSTESKVDSCWNGIMFGFPVPKTDDDWKAVICDDKTEEPLALLKEVESCVNRYGDPENKCISSDFLEEHNAYYYWLNKIASFEEITNYNEICKKKNMTRFKNEMSSNFFKCVVDTQKPNDATLDLLMKYCWKREQESLWRKPRESWPTKEDDWFQYYCDETLMTERKLDLPNFKSLGACLSDISSLPSRSVFYVEGKEVYDPEQSPNEKVIMQCQKMSNSDDD